MGMMPAAVKRATIAVGASLSGAIDMTGLRLVSIEQPASCEGSAFTLQVAIDGDTDNMVDLQTDSAEWSVTKSATLAQAILLPEAKQVQGFTHLKIRSGTSAAAVVQVTADVVVKLGFIPIPEGA